MVVLEFFGFRSLNPSAFPSSSSHCRSVLCAGAPMERRKGERKKKKISHSFGDLLTHFKMGSFREPAKKKERKGGNPKKSRDPPPPSSLQKKGPISRICSRKRRDVGVHQCQAIGREILFAPFLCPTFFLVSNFIAERNTFLSLEGLRSLLTYCGCGWSSRLL